MDLNAKQKRFCEEYLIDLNATQAAIRAGYSESSAKEIGCENLTKPNIASYIAKRQEEKANELNISINDVLSKFADLVENAEKDSDKIRALESIAKHVGFFEANNKQKQPITNISLADMVKFK